MCLFGRAAPHSTNCLYIWYDHHAAPLYVLYSSSRYIPTEETLEYWRAVMSTVYCYHVLNASVKQIQLIVGSCLEKVLVALSDCYAAALKNASLSVLCYLQCSRAKEQIFYFYLIFDRRHVYLLGNTKNQRNNYELTDSFEIELFSILCTEL